MTRDMRGFLFWLVCDSRVPLGPLAPWVLGLAFGRRPRRVEKESNTYRVTGQYRQDIHATVDADSDADAVRKATRLFRKWLETMSNDVEGVSFGPEETTLDDDVLVTQPRDPTPDDRTYWTQSVELSIYEIVDKVTP